MKHAELCPVCHGKGRLPSDDRDFTTSKWEPICHGCSGRGWVEVGNDPPCPTMFPPAIYTLVTRLY